MQVRVLRHDPSGISDIVPREPEKRGPYPLAVIAKEGESPVAMGAAGPGTTLIVRSGPVGEVPAWMPGPRAEFLRVIQQLEATAGDASLCLWPTALGAISDVPSLRTFLNAGDQRGREWTFLFDPISLLTPAMLPKAEDHLTRLFESLAEHPRRWGTLLADASVGDGRVTPAPLGSGTLTDLILRFHQGGDVVLLDEQVDEQVRLLARHPT